jgi:hypothetical protein
VRVSDVTPNAFRTRYNQFNRKDDLVEAAARAAR